MNRTIRRNGFGASILVGLVTLATAASAQDWPSRNVTVVVPLGAGSASDIMARVVARTR